MGPKKTRSSAFSFGEWCKAAALSTSSRKLLKDNGIVEKKTLVLMTPADVLALQMPLGQQVLLRAALADLGNESFQDNESESAPSRPASPVSSRQDPQPDSRGSAPESAQTVSLLDAGKALDALLAAGDPTQAPYALPEVAKIPEYNPRVHLTLKATNKKAAKIFNFLPDKVKERIQRSRRDRLWVLKGEDGSLSMQTRDPEVFSITPTEWNAANARIMAHLLETGDLAPRDIDLYLAYTVQINEMYELYEWTSILSFDGRYRELQAQHGFAWGDLRMAANSTLLVPRRVPYSQNTMQRNNRMPSQQQNSGKMEDCKKWLASGGKFCPFGGHCRYSHRDLDQAAAPPAAKNGMTQAQTMVGH